MYGLIIADYKNIPQVVFGDHEGGNSLYGNLPIEDIGDIFDE